MSKRTLAGLAVFLATFAAQAAEEPQWLKDARGREGKDPTRLIDARTKILGKVGDKQFKALATAGDLKAKVTLDKASGMVETAEMEMRPQNLLMERIYHKGRF
jgi:hypothetical protein